MGQNKKNILKNDSFTRNWIAYKIIFNFEFYQPIFIKLGRYVQGKKRPTVINIQLGPI